MTPKGKQQLSKQIFYKLFSQQQKTPERDRWINILLVNYSDTTLQETITMLAQKEAPILKAGTYRLNNFSAFRTRDSATHTHRIS
jgi:hypothetical protein